MPANYDLWESPVSGRWYITWTEAGRSKRSTTGTKDYRQARKVLRAFELKQERKSAKGPDTLPISDVLANYWERHAKTLPSAEAIEIRTKRLNKFFGASTVDVIGAASDDRFKAQCLREKLSIGTINLHRGTLRAALKQAVRYNELAVAPFVPADEEPEPRPDFLTRGDVARLLKAARRKWPHVALFIRLAIYTGARRSAILQLTWDRVDLHAGTVDFRLPGVRHSRKRRAVTGLPTRLLASLRRLYERQEGDHVIQYQNARNKEPLTKEGEPKTARSIKSIRRAFDLAAAAAELPSVTPHILKHTAVSWALRVASPWIVSGMTATSIRTLQKVYGKHMMGDLKEAAEAVARASHTRKIRAKPAKRKATTKRRSAKKRPIK